MAYFPANQKNGELKFLLNLIDDLLKDDQFVSHIIDSGLHGSALSVASKAIRFTVNQLKLNDTNLYGQLISELVSVMSDVNTALVREADVSLAGYIVDYFKQQDNIKIVNNLLNSIENYFNGVSSNQEKVLKMIDQIIYFFDNSGNNINKVYTELLSTIYHTTSGEICVEQRCEKNIHYDEFYRFIGYLTQTENGSTKIKQFIEYLKSNKLDNASRELGNLMESIEFIE